MNKLECESILLVHLNQVNNKPLFLSRLILHILLEKWKELFNIVIN